jgi:hypothetical protein
MKGVALQSTRALFEEETPYTKADFLPSVIARLRQTKFPGVPESSLEITSQEGDPDAIIVKRVDPFAATGYLAFQSEQEYGDWLSASLYEPTQDEVEEAMNRGNGT